MAVFKGAKDRDDSFMGGTKADRFEFDPLDLTRGDTIVGGIGKAFDVLRFTTPGAVGIAALANVSGIERIELADGGTNSLVLTDAFVASANGARVQIVGGSGDDFVYAADLYDGSAIDFVSNGGTDYVFGGESDDTFTFDIAGLDSSDRVVGGAGSNTLILSGSGTVDEQQLAGLTGINTVALGDGGISLAITNILFPPNVSPILTVNGGAGADVIDARGVQFAYHFFLSGGGGDDVIFGGATYDASVIDGGAGADTITADNATVVYDAGDVSVGVGVGTLLLRGAATIDLTQDDDQSMGDANVVTGFTTASAAGSKVAVRLTGGVGDTLIGGAGRDTIRGASVIEGGGGADTLTGINGTHFILRDGDFARGEVIRSPGGSFLQVYGTNDLRTGTVSGITGLGFGDFFHFGGHVLTARSSQLAALTYIGGDSGKLTIEMDQTGVLLPSFSADIFNAIRITIDVTGTKGRDIIVGPYHEVHAGDGNDVITATPTFLPSGGENFRLAYNGEGGDDVVTVDLSGRGTIDGGVGVDTMVLSTGYSEWFYNRTLIVDLAKTGDQIDYASFGAASFENVDLSWIFSYYKTDVTARGSDDANVLIGSANADTIIGRGGDDVIDGDYGADKLTGGAGADRFQFSHRGERFIDGSDVTDTITDFTIGEDTLLFSREDANGNVVFDVNRARFDVRVEADTRSANLDGADLVIYTAGKLSSADEVNGWLLVNGTADTDEGMFVVARNGANHAILYYVSNGPFESRYATSAIADLGSTVPDQITLSDFAFI